MTKKRQHWFDMASGPDESGRHVRYYRIECRCGRFATHHAGSFTDEKLKKIFARDGWEIGRTPLQHLCPECKHKKVDKVAAQPDPSPTPPAPKPEPAPSQLTSFMRLWEAWGECTEQEQTAFLRAVAPEPEVAVSESRKDIVAPATDIEHEPEPVGGDEPADWWSDLQQSRKFKREEVNADSDDEE